MFDLDGANIGLVNRIWLLLPERGLLLVELDGIAAGALDAAVAPAAATQRDVLVVATNLDLVAVGHDVALAVDAGVDDRLAATGAGGFHLLDGVGKLHQATRALKEVGLEVGTQPVAHHIDAVVVHDAGELVDLVRRQELRLVDEDPVLDNLGPVEHLLEHLVQVAIGIDPRALALDADARADDVVVLAVVDDGLHAQVLHAALLKVIGLGQEHGGLGRAHGAILEV